MSQSLICLWLAYASLVNYQSLYPSELRFKKNDRYNMKFINTATVFLSFHVDTRPLHSDWYYFDAIYYYVISKTFIYLVQTQQP